jgi:hypothetical protein
VRGHLLRRDHHGEADACHKRHSACVIPPRRPPRFINRNRSHAAALAEPPAFSGENSLQSDRCGFILSSYRVHLSASTRSHTGALAEVPKSSRSKCVPQDHSISHVVSSYSICRVWHLINIPLDLHSPSCSLCLGALGPSCCWTHWNTHTRIATLT